MAIKIAIANQKGGVGKTTSVIEIAACMQQIGFHTLVIDLDQQCNLTDYVGGKSTQNNIFTVLRQEINIRDAIQNTPEFDLIPASTSLSKASKELGEAKDVLILRKVLNELNDDYDFIFIDNSPARDVLLNMTYVAADYILIPTEADEGSINGIRAVFNDLIGYKEINWSDAEVLGVILTKTERTGMHDYSRQIIEKLLSEELKSNAFLTEIRKSIVATEAKTEGRSMQVGKKYSKPAMDYRALCDTILDHILGEDWAVPEPETANEEPAAAPIEAEKEPAPIIEETPSEQSVSDALSNALNVFGTADSVSES